MASVTFITVGTLKEDYLKSAILEYTKRISQYAKVEEVNIKESKIADEDNAQEIKKALEDEGEKILSKIPKDAYKVALCVEGTMLDSVALASLLQSAGDKSGKIAFIIGSSHGLSDTVKRAADTRLSFSKLTFPHQLMRVILAEAVYRSFTIIAGKRYHK